MTFFGSARGQKHTHEHAHESPLVMLMPLAILAIGAVFSGMVFYKPFFGDHHKVEVFFGIVENSEAHSLKEDRGFSFISSAYAEEASVESTAKVDDNKVDDYHEGSKKLGKGAIYMAPENHVLDDAHHVHWLVKVSPFFAMLLGFVLSLIHI